MATVSASGVSSRLVLIADRLVDGSGASAIRDPAVIIDEGRIVSVERRTPGWSPPAGHVLVDHGDATILPGLIDAHVHLAIDFESDSASVDRHRFIRTAAAHALQALRSGVTTLRDLGSVAGSALFVRDAINAGLIDGPRIIAADVPITTTGGHLHWFGAIADDRQALVDAVRRVHASGADVVKLMATGGKSTPASDPDSAQYSADEVRAVVTEAHDLGLRVAAHALCTAGVRAAMEGGVDTIEHGWTITGGRQDFDATLVPQLVAAGTICSVTTHDDLRSLLRSGSDEDLQTIRERLAPHRSLMQGGVPLVVHSDAEGGRTRFDRFWESVAVFAHGMEVEPVAAIQAATSLPAAALGLDGQLGSIAEGYVADVLIVEGDASQDVNALGNVRSVYLGGNLVDGHRKQPAVGPVPALPGPPHMPTARC